MLGICIEFVHHVISNRANNNVYNTDQLKTNKLQTVEV